jgi:hypothetical protein
LPQVPRAQHFQGSQAPKSTKAAQECQLVLNMRVDAEGRHALKTPRNEYGYRSLSDKERQSVASPLTRPVPARQTK